MSSASPASALPDPQHRPQHSQSSAHHHDPDSSSMSYALGAPFDQQLSIIEPPSRASAASRQAPLGAGGAASSSSTKVEPPTLHQEKSTTLTSLSAGAQANTSGGIGRRWTHNEDLLLIAAVHKHGHHDWHPVMENLERAGTPGRPAAAVAARYLRLTSHASRQQDLAASGTVHATSSSSASLVLGATPQRQQPTLAELTAASLDLTSYKPKEVFGPWTHDEDDALMTAARSCSRSKGLYAAFCRQLPKTKRTQSAVQSRWNQVLKHRKVKGSGGNGGEGGSSSGGGGEVSVTAHQASASAAAPFTLVHGQPCQQAPISHVDEDAVSARTQAQLDETGTQGVHEATDAQQQPSRPPLPTAAPATAQAPSPSTGTAPDALLNDFIITGQPNGFVIRSLPPLYQLHILKPKQYRVVGPQWAAAPQSVAQPATAPFVFAAGPDGLIHALTLPQGVTSSVNVVHFAPSSDHGQNWGEAEGSEVAQAASLIEQRWVGADGYTVVFESGQATIK